jgi:2-polyprenyl-3-methyl-5-hydroxy-6-metoxy-1,4-benzoquinol methylase
MTENVQICPLCENDHSRLFDRREFRGQEVTNRLCLNCGLVYQSPRMTENEADGFYAQKYRFLYEGSSQPTARNLADQRGRAESLYKFSRTSIVSIRQHLDIGCSVGVLVQYFQEAYRCRSVGIEPDEEHRVQAQKDGLAVYAKLDELEKSEQDRFDLISIVHVLEHLPDPVSYITHLRERFLASDGWLLVEVPNLYAHDSFEIAHLVAYSSHTLKQVLKKARFDVVKAELHGRPRSRLLPLYVSLLARPASVSRRIFALHPEKRVSYKRQTGMLRRRILEHLFPHQAWISPSE